MEQYLLRYGIAFHARHSVPLDGQRLLRRRARSRCQFTILELPFVRCTCEPPKFVPALLRGDTRLQQLAGNLLLHTSRKYGRVGPKRLLLSPLLVKPPLLLLLLLTLVDDPILQW